MVRKTLRSSGVSPKLIAAVIVGAVTFALTKLAISLDPILEQAINAVAIAIAVAVAGPGDVVVEPEPDVKTDEFADTPLPPEAPLA